MKETLYKRIAKHKAIYLLLLPALLWYVVFCYIPMAGIVVAFKDYSFFKGFSASPWVGLKWFKYLIDSPDFFVVFRNTFLISLYTLVFAFPAPVIFALLLNECRRPYFKRVVQTFSYLPHFLSWAIIAGFIVTILSPSSGVVNQLLKLFGINPIYFMAESQYTRAIMVLSSVWQRIGWGSIIYLAAITNINPLLYEAAIMDGASRWKQMWHITLPAMSSLIVMMLVLEIPNLMQVGFDQAYNLVIPPTYDTGEVLSIFVYKMGVEQMNYSFGTAVGLAQSVVSIVLLSASNFIAKRFNEEGAVW